ncbi:MAG: DUF2142 domain-containing protein [Phototrophicaceae bacterium]
MEQENSEFQQKLNDWLYKIGDTLTLWGQRMLVILQKIWAWYKSINWPDIPLTAFQLVILFYVIFGIMFMVSTPILEASDELWHFGMLETIRENDGALPEHDVSDPDRIYENNRDTIYRQEASQPPLYYYTMALLTSSIDISDAEAYRIPNPHVRAGQPDSFGNKNLVLHAVDGVPLQGTPLAIYMVRVLGIAMGVVTIWAVWQSGELIAPHRPVVGLLAGVITAFNPMFLFISASVNNDTMVIMLNSVVILLALQTLREGFDHRRSLLLAVLLGLATLTKLSALVLVPVIAIAALWVARRDKNWTGLLVLGIAMFVAWATIAGWWYVRNITLYGELFGTQTMAAVAGVRAEPYNFFTFFSEFEGFRQGYWGVFGAFNIITNPLIYAIFDFVVFIGIFGVIFLVAQLVSIQDFSFARREISLVLFLLGIILLGFIAYINWTSQTYASQGRLLFPYFAAISPLLAVGLIEILWWILFLLSPPDRSYVRAGDAVPEPILRESLQWPIRIFGLMILLIPLFTIAPQYQAPKPLDAVPDDIQAVYARYDGIELIGYDRIDRRYFPGEKVRLTLYWRVIEPTEDDLTLAIALINPFEDVISERTISTYPGAGTLRTSTWEAGQIYADTYELPLVRNINSRYPFTLTVNWYDDIPEDRVIALNEADNTINVGLQIGAVIQPNLSVSFGNLEILREINPAERTFGSVIRVEGLGYTEFEDDNLFNVDVLWESQSDIDKDYIAFMHIYDDDGQLVTQYDFQYQLPTRYWTFNEDFRLTYFVVPPENGFSEGTYRVSVGWYEKENPANRLIIQEATAELPEISTYDLFSFDVDASGEIILPELDIDDPDDLLQVAPEPSNDEAELTPELELTEAIEATETPEETQAVESDSNEE